MHTSPGHVDFADRNWKYWTEPEFVDVGGLPTAYRREGSGPTVVYLHGGGNTRAWLPFHAEMAKHFDVIAPEHPGFGDTPRPDGFGEWTDWVLHYEAFFRALKLENIHLVGNSLGGLLAAKLAVFYPTLFKSVTLITPVGLLIEDEPLRDLYRWTPEEAGEALFHGRIENYLDQLIQAGSPEDDVQAYKEQTTSALLFWNPRYDIKLDQQLSRIQCPFLSIGVDEDRVAGNRMAGRFAELVPGGKTSSVPGRPSEPSGHMVFMEQPEETVFAIAEHISANS